MSFQTAIVLQSTQVSGALSTPKLPIQHSIQQTTLTSTIQNQIHPANLNTQKQTTIHSSQQPVVAGQQSIQMQPADGAQQPYHLAPGTLIVQNLEQLQSLLNSKSAHSLYSVTQQPITQLNQPPLNVAEQQNVQNPQTVVPVPTQPTASVPNQQTITNQQIVSVPNNQQTISLLLTSMQQPQNSQTQQITQALLQDQLLEAQNLRRASTGSIPGNKGMHL